MIKVTVILRGWNGMELDMLTSHIRDWEHCAAALTQAMGKAQWVLSPGDTISIDGE
jgi:hypothetical protein